MHGLTVTTFHPRGLSCSVTWFILLDGQFKVANEVFVDNGERSFNDRGAFVAEQSNESVVKLRNEGAILGMA